MMNKKLITLAYCLVVCISFMQAQERTEYKFGKISPADFKLPVAKFDSGASAIIMSDIGSTSFEGNDQGFFTLVFTRYMRVKIINKTGFDVGNYLISLYHTKSERERLHNLKGSTFIEENGIISETKLDEKSVFTEKYNKNYDRVKFSMPALREGAIFDIEYKIKSPFYFGLRPWAFQGEYPRLISEYVVTIPPPFHYMVRQQGYDKYDVSTAREVSSSYVLRQNDDAHKGETLRLHGSARELRWLMKNVPAIKPQPFITNLDNYNSRVSFQINYFQWENMEGSGDRHNFLENWSSTSRTLLQDEDFGIALNHVNSWMGDDLKELIRGARSNEEKARIIYRYVQNNFKVGHKQGYNKNSIWAINSLKEVFNKKEGNVAEINLLLTAMLRHEDIKADPLILSTRDNGYASAQYPLIDEYNYVICVAYFGDKTVTLDASRSYNNFGQLPVDCYNGYGHIMNEQNPLAIGFFSDSLSEISTTSVFINNDEKGQPSGSLKTVFGNNGSFNKREEIVNGSDKTLEKHVQTLYGSEITIENFGVDSLNKYEFPLAIHYDFLMKNQSSGDMYYFNPMLNEGYKTNPFVSMERQYPVEMPYKIDETYLLNMEIPTGFQVEELPKSVKVAFNEGEGSFEYLIQKGENNIQMRVRLKLNKAFFPTDEYGPLRDFFAFVVKKENEQIVFKKIK